MPKQGLDPSVFLFDNERNCMVIKDGDLKKSCVNWHQYSMKARIEKLDQDDQEVVVQKDRLQGSFVACLGESEEGHPCVVIVSHAIVHPVDINKATKVHGRTVAARRMVKAIRGGFDSTLFVFGEYIDKDEACHVVFCSLDPDIPRMMNLNNPEFLPAIYRRLKKISG